MHSGLRFIVAIAPTALLLAACGGGGPSSSDTHKAIEQAVLTANTAAFDSTAGVEVVDVDIKSWETQTLGELTMRHAEWSAKLRLTEPLAAIVSEVNGTKIVSIVADKGEEIPFTGDVTAGKLDGNWQVDAQADGGLMDAGAWQTLWDKVGGVTMGYQVYDAQGNMTVRGRGPAFQPMSALQPCVVQGSPEEAKLLGGGR